MWDLLILILAMSLLPLGAIKYVDHKTGHKMAVWKQVICVSLFEFSFAPYTSFLFLASAHIGWMNLIYFILIWMLFYVFRFVLPARFTVIAPIVLGLMLMEPASSFITMSDGHIAINLEPSRTIDLSRRGDKVLDFLHILYRTAWAVLPLVGVHYLMKSRPIEKMEHVGAPPT